MIVTSCRCCFGSGRQLSRVFGNLRQFQCFRHCQCVAQAPSPQRPSERERGSLGRMAVHARRESAGISVQGIGVHCGIIQNQPSMQRDAATNVQTLVYTSPFSSVLGRAGSTALSGGQGASEAKGGRHLGGFLGFIRGVIGCHTRVHKCAIGLLYGFYQSFAKTSNLYEQLRCSSWLSFKLKPKARTFRKSFYPRTLRQEATRARKRAARAVRPHRSAHEGSELKGRELWVWSFGFLNPKCSVLLFVWSFGACVTTGLKGQEGQVNPITEPL